MITLTKEEIDFIADKLAEVQSKYVYQILKLLEIKVTEANQKKEEKHANSKK